MNGDRYSDAQLDAFVAEHRPSGAARSLIGSAVDDRSDCGSIVADKGGHVLRFVEKAVNRGPRYLQCGNLFDR